MNKRFFAEFEKMLLSPTRPAMQDMYLDLFRAWTLRGLEKSATALDLAEELRFENPQVFRGDQGCVASNLALLGGLLEMGLISVQKIFPHIECVLTDDGKALLKRHADLIVASKDRPITGNWGDDF